MKENIPAMESLKLQGWTYEEIGKQFNISRQRVQQILKPEDKVLYQLIGRSKGKCEQCGKAVFSQGHVHHKLIRGKPINSLDNLFFLCINCHEQIDHSTTEFGTTKERDSLLRQFTNEHPDYNQTQIAQQFHIGQPQVSRILKRTA